MGRKTQQGKGLKRWLSQEAARRQQQKKTKGQRDKNKNKTREKRTTGTCKL